MDAAMKTGDFLRAGRYEINRLLRSAPDKRVYLAHDRVLDRPVVVDIFSNNSILPSGLTVSAWEARVLGQLDDHQNIATACDYWEDDETAVMVSRYLSGGTLKDRIARSQETARACLLTASASSRLKLRVRLRIFMAAAFCTAICSLATCYSMSGVRSTWWTSILQYRLTTAL